MSKLRLRYWSSIWGSILVLGACALTTVACRHDAAAPLGGVLSSGGAHGTNPDRSGTGGKGVASCLDGEVRCGQSCVVLNSNAKNCGQCGKACPGIEACVNQVCQCASPNKVCGGP